MTSLRFVPAYKPLKERHVRDFIRAFSDIEKLFVITGAGISTESGIPDYRSEGVGQYARTDHKPITHQEFMKSERNRQRYWSRNFLAWPKFRVAQPNATHFGLSAWERSDRFGWLLTQNVDGLHTKAGSSKVTELHGSGHRVRCMECDFTSDRDSFQSMMAEANPSWTEKDAPGELNPDGDVTIEKGAEETFNVVPCPNCGGIMKTDVVFFGDNVSRKVVEFCYEQLESCDAVMVLGSSLMVMSGYRFVYHASLREMPIFIVNIGPTRADHLATHRLSCKASDIITRL